MHTQRDATFLLALVTGHRAEKMTLTGCEGRVSVKVSSLCNLVIKTASTEVIKIDSI